MISMGTFHSSFISIEFIEQEKKSLGLATSIDTRNYGEIRVHHLLRK